MKKLVRSREPVDRKDIDALIVANARAFDHNVMKITEYRAEIEKLKGKIAKLQTENTMLGTEYRKLGIWKEKLQQEKSDRRG